MLSIEVKVDEDLLGGARQCVDEQGTTLEALLAEHVALLADRAGRRLSLREQTYAGYRPPEEVVEALRTKASGTKGKTH
jgi:hypothetical protein